MRGITSRVPEELLAHRRRTGEDRWDEVWSGVLHLTPAPSLEHQRIVDRLVRSLGPLVERARRGQLWSGINVCDAPTGWENFRVTDLTFVAAGREHVAAPDAIRFGGPDAVVEVRSPDDETYEKLPFFARLGVGEILVVDRDSKQVEVFALRGTEYVRTPADAEGWLVSAILGVRFRTDGAPPRVILEDIADPAVRAEI